MNKKTIAICAVCMVLVAALSVFTTLALLTDSKTVTNTFTSGNVSIILNEAKVVPTDDGGNGIMTSGTERATANTYKLYPKQSYVKDPTVTVNGGSEACYVGAVITVSAINGNALTNLTSEDYAWNTEDANLAFANYLTAMGITINAPETDKAGWIVNKTATGYVYTYVYSDVVSASASDQKLTALFGGFTVPESISDKEIATIDDVNLNSQLKVLQNLKIEVTAYAAQAQTFNSAAEALNAAFPTVFSATNAA